MASALGSAAGAMNPDVISLRSPRQLSSSLLPRPKLGRQCHGSRWLQRAAAVGAGGAAVGVAERSGRHNSRCRQPRKGGLVSASSSSSPSSSSSSSSPSLPPSRASNVVPAALAAKSEEATLSPSPLPSSSSSSSPSTVVHFFRRPFLSTAAATSLLALVQEKISDEVESVDSEQCFNVGLSAPLTNQSEATLKWLLTETFEPDSFSSDSFLEASSSPSSPIVEVGPRLSFTTAWSANAVSICSACGVAEVSRIERSRRFLLRVREGGDPLSEEQLAAFAALVHDRMTETVFESRLLSFATDAVPAPVERIPVVEEGRAALEKINASMGLAFDDWDLDFYTRLFRDDLKRNPSNVELFDIAQSNSEHSRHWFFKGELWIDGEKKETTLMDLVKDTLRANRNNSVIGFKDNSSAIRGTQVSPLMPLTPGQPSAVAPLTRDLDILFTAETHNFPCAVAPYPGAETGAGGRIRDTHATGTGSLVVAATAGYCVGNLQLESLPAPWEDVSFEYPSNLASPLQILIDASDGASDYGNKFGEPLIQGYTRTFGMRLPNGERREWIKPIMFSAGIGQIDHRHLEKEDPDLGMLVVKIGGPAYRIGMGGGAASSMVSGTRDAELDFNAVQRGDAEMAQKLFRVVRTCVEMGEKNPIVSIHDQGAGGNCNVVKEIIYPKGAEIDIRSVVVGDETMSVLEIWGAEYQEQDAILIRPESESLLRSICGRERLSMAVIGSISGSGRVVLVDRFELEAAAAKGLPPPPPAVDLDLEKVLGDMPNKRFDFVREQPVLEPLDLPPIWSVREGLRRVLTLPSVASKRFLTTKVDRCVTGLVAQQQTVGPLQITLADVAVIAQSHTGVTGAACAIGEQPIKGLLSPACMARMAVGEALTNLVWAKATSLSDVKASGNWMYAAKMGGEGAAMFDAAEAMKEAMMELEIAIDGGKDSLSMAATAGGEVVKAPGNLVISAYVTCPDVALTVTPDLKLPGNGVLLHVDLASGRRRLGGSALAQVYDQIGDECPDADVALLKRAFNTVQDLLPSGVISAGHDISDGGLVTSALEMAFAGNCGVELHLLSKGERGEEGEEGEEGRLLSQEEVAAELFAEELGLIIEVAQENKDAVLTAFATSAVPCRVIGRVTEGSEVKVSVGGELQVEGSVAEWRDVWESPSFELERKQRSQEAVAAEQDGLKSRTTPSWNLPFTPTRTPDELLSRTSKVKVAILREEGSNGDREMAAAVWASGMEPWDVAMSDLMAGLVDLSDFRGVIFVGGFSYADVLDSAKGWAATIRFNASLLQQFAEFYARDDTFSLGVCNGCQLMALLGWVPGPDVGGAQKDGGDLVQPRFVHNKSGRFECRFSSVEVQPSPAIMLKGMEGTRVGIWTAHGEGQALFPDDQIFETVLSNNLAPIRYCDDEGNTTEAYPFNPNGSPLGIAALCSPNGRHLAMMPHPERCYLMWQFPWAPKEWSTLEKAGPSPWLKIFQNAREWCEGL